VARVVSSLNGASPPGVQYYMQQRMRTCQQQFCTCILYALLLLPWLDRGVDLNVPACGVTRTWPSFDALARNSALLQSQRAPLVWPVPAAAATSPHDLTRGPQQQHQQRPHSPHRQRAGLHLPGTRPRRRHQHPSSGPGEAAVCVASCWGRTARGPLLWHQHTPREQTRAQLGHQQCPAGAP
jgi:hypothetical protein